MSSAEQIQLAVRHMRALNRSAAIVVVGWSGGVGGENASSDNSIQWSSKIQLVCFELTARTESFLVLSSTDANLEQKILFIK